MSFDLFEDERLVLFPVKDFTGWHVLRPVAPIEDKDSDGWLIVGKRVEEVPLKIAIISTVAAVAFRGTRAR